VLFLQVFKDCLTASQSWYFTENTPSGSSGVPNPEQRTRESNLILTTAGKAQQILTREELRRIIEARRIENSPSESRPNKSKWWNRIGSFASNVVKDVTLQTLREAERAAREKLREDEKLKTYHEAQIRAARAAVVAEEKGLLTLQEKAMYEKILTKLDGRAEELIKGALKEAIRETLDVQANQSTEPQQTIQKITNKFEEKINALIKQTDGEIKEVLKTIKEQGLSSNLGEILKTFLKDTTESSTTTEQEQKQEQNSHSQGLQQLDEMIDKLAIKIAIQNRKVKGGRLEGGQHWLEKIATKPGHPAAAFAIGVTAAGLRRGLQYLDLLNLATTGAVGAGVGALRGYLQSREQFERGLQRQAYGTLVAPNNPTSEQVSTGGNGQQSVQNQSGQRSLSNFAKAASWIAKLNAELNTARVEYTMVSAQKIVDGIEQVARQTQEVAGQIQALNSQNLNEFLELVSGIDSQIRAILNHWRKGNPTMMIDLTDEEAQNLGINFDQLKQLPPDLAYRTILYAIQARWLSLQPEIQSKVEKIRSVGNHRAGTEAVKARIEELQQNISNAYKQDTVRRWKKIGADALLGATAAGAGFEVGQGVRHLLSTINWRPQQLLEMLGKIFEPPVASAAESSHVIAPQLTTNGILNGTPVKNVILDGQGSASSSFHGEPSLAAGVAGSKEVVVNLPAEDGAVDSESFPNLENAGSRIHALESELSRPHWLYFTHFTNAETPTPNLETLLSNPHWRSKRLDIAAFLGKLAQENQNLKNILITNGELDKEKVTALAEALTNAKNPEEFEAILDRFQNNPEGEFTNWIGGAVRGKGRYGPIRDYQQQLLLAMFMQANGMTVPEDFEKILQVVQAAQALNTEENIQELAKAIEGAIGPKFDPGDWVMARAAVAQALSTKPDLAVIIQNDPKRATALAEAIVRAYKQGGLQRIEATLADLASDPDGFFTRQIKMIDGRVSEETQKELLGLMTDQAPGTGQGEPGGGTGQGEPGGGTGQGEPGGGTGQGEPGGGTGQEAPQLEIDYKEAIINHFQKLFGSSNTIPEGKYISFDPTNLPDISQTEATTVLRLDLSENSMAEAMDGLDKIAGRTDKPIVLAIQPNGPNAGVEALNTFWDELNRNNLKDLKEAIKQGRVVFAFVQKTEEGIIIGDPKEHIDPRNVIAGLGQPPTNKGFGGLLGTDMPIEIAETRINMAAFLKLLDENDLGGIQILQPTDGEVSRQIRTISEVFGDSINQSLTYIAKKAGTGAAHGLNLVVVKSSEGNMIVDPGKLLGFIGELKVEKIQELNDHELTLLITLITRAYNSDNLEGIISGLGKPNSNLPETTLTALKATLKAILAEAQKREGISPWVSIGGVALAALAALVGGVGYYISRRQANPEIQRIQGEATNIINDFVTDLRNSSLDEQQLQTNWTTIIGVLNNQQGQGQSEINNLIDRIQRRVADSQTTGNLDLTPELTELSKMVYRITNLLESIRGWDPQSHDTNIIAVFRAILFEAYRRERGSQIQAIEDGLTELETNLQNNQEIDLNMVGSDNVTNINGLILNGQVGLSQSERDLWDQLIQNSWQNSQAIIGSLRNQQNQQNQQIVRSIAAKIVVALETNRNWDSNERLNNLKAVARVLAYMVQEIQKTREAATNNIINGFVQDLRANFQNNNLITQELQRNWTVIQGALNALSQQGQGQNLGLNAIDNLIRSIQRRVADSQATGNLDLTPELTELSKMVYRITNLLESIRGWDPQSHDTNIIAVFRAILFEAYRKERDSQIQAIKAGLTELQTNLQNNQEIDLNMVGSNNVTTINNLILDDYFVFTQDERDLWNRLIQNGQQNPQDIITSLKDQNNEQIVRSIAAKIVVALETNRNWDSNERLNNLKAVARVLAYMVQEIQKIQTDAPSTINGFVGDLRTNLQNNNPDTQELQRNWTVIQGALNTLSQRGRNQNLGLNAINDLIDRIRRRIADSEATGTVDLTPELPELSRMVYNITNLLESESGWLTTSHGPNIIAVFRAILYEAYNRERGSQNQAIRRGLTKLENSGFTSEVTGNNYQLILSLISSSQNNNAPIVIDQSESSILHRLDQQLQPLLQTTPSNPQHIVQTLDGDQVLEDTYRRVVARIVVYLESPSSNPRWNRDAREDNLDIVAQVLAYMIARNDLSTP